MSRRADKVARLFINAELIARSDSFFFYACLLLC